VDLQSHHSFDWLWDRVTRTDCRRLLQWLAFSESRHLSWDKDPANTMAYDKLCGSLELFNSSKKMTRWGRYVQRGLVSSCIANGRSPPMSQLHTHTPLSHCLIAQVGCTCVASCCAAVLSSRRPLTVPPSRHLAPAGCCVPSRCTTLSSSRRAAHSSSCCATASCCMASIKRCRRHWTSPPPPPPLQPYSSSTAATAATAAAT
jgi:hypothetical protein